MSESDRIVYPDEVEDVKAAAEKANATEGGDSNSIETPAGEQPAVGVAMRNMIVVPDNCPPGYKRGNDGVCREVFD